jgi:hypothetical protein
VGVRFRWKDALASCVFEKRNPKGVPPHSKACPNTQKSSIPLIKKEMDAGSGERENYCPKKGAPESFSGARDVEEVRVFGSNRGAISAPPEAASL